MKRQRHRGFYLAKLVSLGCIAIVGAFAFAQMTPEVVFKATETSLEVPEQLGAGFHYFALDTDGMKEMAFARNLSQQTPSLNFLVDNS
jgi:hypothetical protein